MNKTIAILFLIVLIYSCSTIIDTVDTDFTNIELDDGNYKNYWNGKLFVDFNVKNKQIDSTCKWYYQNGKLKTEAFYVNGLCNGILKDYRKDGSLEYLSNCINGKINGVSYMYWKNGNIKREATVIDNVCNGISTSFNKKGLISSVRRCVGGKSYGWWKSYYHFPNDSIKSIVNCYHREKEGEFMIFYKSGGLKQKGHYSKNKKNGILYYYDTSGKIVDSVVFDNGKRIKQKES